MNEWCLNIVGTEWIIIIFVALVLILGTNKLPEAARKLGRAHSEYTKARDQVQGQMRSVSDINISGPVQNERQKLESMARSLGINFESMDTDQLRQAISARMGQRKDDP